jgi:hypothetical protein
VLSLLVMISKRIHLPYAQQYVRKSVEMLITQMGSELPAPCQSLRSPHKLDEKRPFSESRFLFKDIISKGREYEMIAAVAQP